MQLSGPIILSLSSLAAATFSLNPHIARSTDCSVYGYPAKCSSSCDVIFDQINGCDAVDADDDASCHCYIPPENSLTALACESCISSSMNGTAQSFGEALDEIQNVLEVCAFGTASASSTAGSVSAPTGVPAPKVTGGSSPSPTQAVAIVTAGQVKTSVSALTLFGAVAAAVTFFI